MRVCVVRFFSSEVASYCHISLRCEGSLQTICVSLVSPRGTHIRKLVRKSVIKFQEPRVCGVFPSDAGDMGGK